MREHSSKEMQVGDKREGSYFSGEAGTLGAGDTQSISEQTAASVWAGAGHLEEMANVNH